MAHAAKPGKQKSHSGAKKRVRVTGSGKVMLQKAAHNHRLDPKNARQLSAASKPIEVTGRKLKVIKRQLAN